MTPSTRWQTTNTFPETDHYWNRIEWIQTKPHFFPHSSLKPTKLRQQNVQPDSDEIISPHRNVPTENPLVGLYIFLLFFLVIFFGAHWVKQSVSVSIGQLDMHTILFLLSER